MPAPISTVQPLQALSRFAGRLLRAVLVASAFAAASQAQAVVESVRLADVIRSNGTGSINLLMGNGDTPISPAALEALRQEHIDTSTGAARNFLTLGVDVNENAKGLENSNAMGITVAAVTLTVTRPSGTTVYTSYRTRTQALLAPSGSSVRQRYYSLLGEAGSSRISSANSIQAAFDSTLDIFVPDSLADATAVQLQVTLLNVNKTLGDPESFYDYSGGFEDLALLNQQDAQYLNTTLAASAGFRTGAPAVEPVQGIVSNDSVASGTSPTAAAPASWVYFPSATTWYKVAYEDNFPNKGDYDFNDAVVAYRYKLGLDSAGRVVRVEAESYLVADGAWFTLDWHLRLPIAGSGTVTCSRTLPGAPGAEPCSASLQAGALDAVPYDNIDNSGRYFSGTPGWAANAVKGAETKLGGYATVVVVLDSPISTSAVGEADPWLYVRDTAQSIHLSSRDPSGFPYAMLLPSDWTNPGENKDMGLAYPKFRNFVQSSGAADRDWYLNPAAEHVFSNPSWRWGP